MTPVYVNAKGEVVAKADATSLRFTCECGEHRWDVPIATVTKQTTAEIRRYAEAAHKGKT